MPVAVAVLSTGEAESNPLKYTALAAFEAGTVAEKLTVMVLPEFNCVVTCREKTRVRTPVVVLPLALPSGFTTRVVRPSPSYEYVV